MYRERERKGERERLREKECTKSLNKSQAYDCNGLNTDIILYAHLTIYVSLKVLRSYLILCCSLALYRKLLGIVSLNLLRIKISH